MVEILSVIAVIGYLWSQKQRKTLEKITQQTIDYLNKIYMLTQLVDYSQGFIFFSNKLIFSSLNDKNLQEYMDYKDVEHFCQKQSMKYELIMDHHPLKMIKIQLPMEDNINYIKDNQNLNVVLDAQYNILSWVNNNNIFHNPEGYHLQQWWNQLIDKEIVMTNTYEELMKSLKNKTSYLLTTLQEQCFMVDMINYNNQTILQINEVTNAIKTQSDLYNNTKLIQYLIQSLRDPIIVFNKDQTMEFVNNEAQEILNTLDIHHDEAITIQKLSNLFSHCKKENLLTINDRHYQLKTKIIGNFMCWILMEKTKIINNTISFNPSAKEQLPMEDNLQQFNFLTTMNQNPYNKKISMGLIHTLEKYNYNQGQHQEAVTMAFKDFIQQSVHQWSHEKKIIIVNDGNQDQPWPVNDLALRANSYFLKKIFGWIVGEIIHWSPIKIQFKALENRCYMLIKILSFPSNWASYQEEFLKYLKKSYGPMMENNNGSFHYSINNWQPVIQIVFRSYQEEVVYTESFESSLSHANKDNLSYLHG